MFLFREASRLMQSSIQTCQGDEGRPIPTHPDQDDVAAQGPRYTWNIPGMPRRGWVCAEVVDHGDANQSCEACGNPAVRFLHTIRHPEFRDLEVGCDCAGHLTGDCRGAKGREATLKRKATWADSPRWKRSRRGNAWRKAGGFRVVVFPYGPEFRLAISGNFFGPYPDQRAAKLAAFDIVAVYKRDRKSRAACP
jgi:hypothetical protein